MYKEIKIPIGNKTLKVFLQRGFYLHLPPTKRIHKHNYSDVHIVAGGDLLFYTDKGNFLAKDGTLFIIPKDTFHYCITKDENAVHTAFQVDYEVDQILTYEISPDTLFDFFRAIEKVKESGDYTRVVTYISLFCSYFFDGGSVAISSITDYGFLIREFFQTQYGKEVKLRNIAEVLNVCERQAERLVLEYTGKSFRDELAFTRIAMAKQLLKIGQMSMQEVASYVGYRTYAGFWKAMKKYEGMVSEE